MGSYGCTAKERYVHLIVSGVQLSYLFKFFIAFIAQPVLLLLQDNVIFERLTEDSQYKELTVAHLEQFATEG